MIFQHTIDKVLSGEKTQTRRIVKPGEGLQYDDNPHWNAVMAFDSSQVGFHRTKWAIGNTYAVQPGRGKKAVARIRILSIRREDVRTISDEDVKAEGFQNVLAFWKTWCGMHDKDATKYLPETMNPVSLLTNKYGIRDYLNMRPAERYDAWAIKFEVVK